MRAAWSMRHWWAMFLLCLLAGATAALDLSGDEANLRLGPEVEVLRDRGGRMTLADVLQADAFAPARDHPDLSFGYTADVLWLKLPLRSRAPRVQSWRIEFEYATVDRIELFEVGDGGSVTRKRSGDRMPFGERSYAHRNPVFALTLAPDESRVLYLRAESQGTMTLSSALWSDTRFRAHSEGSIRPMPCMSAPRSRSRSPSPPARRGRSRRGRCRRGPSARGGRRSRPTAR